MGCIFGKANFEFLLGSVHCPVPRCCVLAVCALHRELQKILFARDLSYSNGI